MGSHVSNLQTLERGIAVLERIAAANGTMTQIRLAEELQVHRSIISRIISTLHARGLVRQAGRQLWLGAGVLALSRQCRDSVPSQLQPVLDQLAQDCAATVCLVTAEGREVVVVGTATDPSRAVQLHYQTGHRHALGVSATGVALLAARAPDIADSAEVQEARARGYAVSEGVIQPGTSGVCMPLTTWRDGLHRFEGAITVVRIGAPETERTVPRLVWARDQARALLLAAPGGAI